MRHHMTVDGPVQFTPEEEAQRDVEEATWSAQSSIEQHNGPLMDEIVDIESETGFTRKQREYMIANLSDVSLKSNLQSCESSIALIRAKLRK